MNYALDLLIEHREYLFKNPIGGLIDLRESLINTQARAITLEAQISEREDELENIQDLIDKLLEEEDSA